MKVKIAFATAVHHSQRWLFSRYQQALPDTCYQSDNNDDEVDDICDVMPIVEYWQNSFFPVNPFENKYILSNPLSLHGNIHSFCKIFFLILHIFYQII